MAGQRTMLQWDLSVEGSLTFQYLQVTKKEQQTAQIYTPTDRGRNAEAQMRLSHAPGYVLLAEAKKTAGCTQKEAETEIRIQACILAFR